MLIRFVVENMFSFGERKEFNTIPSNRLKTLDAHKYKIKSSNFSMLKLASIYGANGAGKSNLVKALDVLQNLVVNEVFPDDPTHFKLNISPKDKKQYLIIEFVEEDTAFIYGLEILNNKILSEELYLSGLGVTEDKLLYVRKRNSDGNPQITFADAFEKDEKNQLLKSILIEEFVEDTKPILKLLANRDNKYFANVKKAFNWFKQTLVIISPDSRPIALAHHIEHNDTFKQYAETIMKSLHTGVDTLHIEKQSIKDFYGHENESQINQTINKLNASPNDVISIKNSRNGKEYIIIKENDEIWVKSLSLGHMGKNNNTVLFELEEESDGTKRLLDFIPVLQDIILTNRVFVIDEIERSIHPLMIKEIIKKISLDANTKGQLIFTTHEANLLDQNIFRKDEIWFVEKDKAGSTDLYSLSDFKEHKTIDIRKGYLTGRYGSIPFLGNLQDLNWNQHAS